MTFVKKLITLIDTINEWVGRIFSCLIIPLMLLIVFEVFTRRILGNPTVWTFEVITQLYAALFMMAAPLTLLLNRHVSVDIFAMRLSPKKRAVMDILTYLIFFFPFVLVLFNEGFEYARLSWELLEKKHSAGFAMPIYPLKSVIPVTAFLLFLQGISVVIKKIIFLKTER
jgi:TRAP-type mannitol/chloroaromatic compound transport system permease small subunit